MSKKIFLLCLFNVLIINLFSQYPKNFGKPLNGILKISGNFAELRKNHFHTGLDFSINRQVGLPVYAVADGYVSRIKVSPSGYGRVVYITHYNGYRSVYAHLNSFSPNLQKLINKLQYDCESFYIDYYPPDKSLKINKGQIIGYTGNTGTSYGAHLHFEIRDTNDLPFNPQLFGLPIKDTKKPVIRNIVIYPATDTSIVNFKTEPLIKKVQIVNGKYHLNPPIVIYGPVYFGIETYDYIDYVNSRNAVYSVKLYVDDTLILSYKFDRIPFELQRTINSFTDYKIRNLKGYRIQRSLVEPGNKLPIYDSIKNNGIVVFNDNDFHIVKYKVSDIQGNTRSISFQVKNSLKIAKYHFRKELPHFAMKMKYNKDNKFSTDSCEVFVPENALFSDTGLIYSVIYDSLKQTKVYTIGNYFIPLSKSFVISLKGDTTFKDKTLIVKEDYSGKKTALRTIYKDGWFTAQSKEFGKFYLAVDTVPPKIKPLYDYQGKKLTGFKRMRFKATDNLSEVSHYYGVLNGEWVLIEYDKKNDLLIFNFQNKPKKGKNKFYLIVGDKKMNYAQLKIEFYY